MTAIEELYCPACGEPLGATRDDPWEVIRSLAASHLRRCRKAPKGRREIGTMAIRIADEAVYAGRRV